MNLNLNINLFKIIIVISLVIIIFFLINHKKFEKMENLTDCSGVQDQKTIERWSTKLSKMISDLNDKINDINDLNRITYTNIAKFIDSEYYKRQLFIRIPNIRLEFNNNNYGYNLIFDTPRHGDVINDMNGDIVKSYTPGTDFFIYNNIDLNKKIYFTSSNNKFYIVRKYWVYYRKYILKTCAVAGAASMVSTYLGTALKVVDDACWKKDLMLQTDDRVLEISENINNIFNELNNIGSITNTQYNKKMSGDNIIGFIPSNTSAKNILETKMCITDFNNINEKINKDQNISNSINNILKVINTQSSNNVLYYYDTYIYVEIPNLKLSIDSKIEIDGVYNYSLTFDDVGFKNISYFMEKKDHYKNNRFDLTKYIKINSVDQIDTTPNYPGKKRYTNKNYYYYMKNSGKHNIKKNIFLDGDVIDKIYMNNNNKNNNNYYFGKYMNDIYFYRDVDFSTVNRLTKIKGNPTPDVTYMNITEQVKELLVSISTYTSTSTNTIIKYNAYPVGNKILLYPDTPPTSKVGSEMKN